MHKNNTVAKSSLSDIVHLRKSVTDRARGFTIIEVMIVLAIAALILLIVLLAVPALQRSSSNTSRKNDASAIEAALSNFINDNNGDMPSTVASSGSTNVLVVGASTTSNTEQANLGYYKAGTSTTGAASSGSIYITTAGASLITPSAVATSTTPSASSVNTNSISIIVGESCNNGTYALSARDIAVSYVTDTGSGNGAIQCTES